MIKPISLSKIETITEIIPVMIDDNETYLEIYNVVRKLTIITKNNSGLTPKIIPPEVATAFPPLNRAKRGYV